MKNKREILVLRDLSRKYFALAKEDRNSEKINLHKNVNDLNQTRPVVLLNELPWAEMNIDHKLDFCCSDPILRKVEIFLRQNLFQYSDFPADMYLLPYIPVEKIIEVENIGVDISEKILSRDDGNHIVSHEYRDQLNDEEKLEKLRIPRIQYNKEKTLHHFNKISDILGDIIPVKLKGVDFYNVTSWDVISTFRGVTPLLMDLIERPEFTHGMVRIFTDIALSQLEQYEKLGLFEDDPYSLHHTPIANSTLKPLNEDKITRKNIWGRGAAQIFASVSKKMRKEFDIVYMKETIGQCGLVYYGCCEPLHDMIDIVEEIPNLRKISITPWADVDQAAAVIGKKYVLSSKPNPSSVAGANLDENALRKEIKRILDAAHRNDCNMDIVLKDVSSCGHNPKNILRWEQIVMEMVGNYSW